MGRLACENEGHELVLREPFGQDTSVEFKAFSTYQKFAKKRDWLAYREGGWKRKRERRMGQNVADVVSDLLGHLTANLCIGIGPLFLLLPMCIAWV